MSDDIIRQLKYAASEPCNADCCFSETMGQAADEIERLRSRLAEAKATIDRLSGRLCLVCGAKSPCDTSDACTFDPNPVQAAQEFLRRAAEAEAQAGAMRAALLEAADKMTVFFYNFRDDAPEKRVCKTVRDMCVAALSTTIGADVPAATDKLVERLSERAKDHRIPTGDGSDMREPGDALCGEAATAIQRLTEQNRLLKADLADSEARRIEHVTELREAEAERDRLRAALERMRHVVDAARDFTMEAEALNDEYGERLIDALVALDNEVK